MNPKYIAIMKKSLKIAGIAMATVLVLLIILPYAFKDKIKDIVVSEGNKMLNAEFGIGDIGISLLRDFPKASVSLEDFWLKGAGDFQNDTLIKSERLSASVNLFSLFGDSGYDISKIVVKNTSVKAIVLEDGRTNWDIMKPDSTAAPETESEEESSAFRIKLKKVSLEGIRIIYDDRQGKMYAGIQNLNLTCSGDMSAERTTLKVETDMEKLLFRMNGIPFLSNAELYAKLDIDADMQNRKYVLKDNRIRLNAIEADLDGEVTLSDTAADMDIKLNTSEVRFKEILSLIPAIYMKDFETLKTDGTVNLEAFAKGRMEGNNLPQFGIKLNVKDGMFRYPSLPAGVDNILVNLEIANPGGDADLTQLKIQPFSFSLAGNPFSMTAEAQTLVSDPDFLFSANGILNLGKIKEVYPLEETELNGIIDADMSVKGKLSYIENENYDKISASGNIRLKDMALKMKEMPDITVQQSTFSFTPRYLNLSETTVRIGQNDLTADCKLENYIAYILKGQTIKGNLNIRSNHFNLNDFMTAEGDSVTVSTEQPEAAVAENTEAAGIIRVPKNIDFNLNADMAQVLFDKMTIADLNGKLTVKDGTVDMKNLSMNTMGGKIVMNGAYSTAEEDKNPDLNASFSMTGLSFAQTFKELDLIQQFAPIFEGLKGNFSGSMKIATELDDTMSPIMNTLQGEGSLQTKDLNLSGVDAIDKIADAVSRPDLKNITVKDVNIDFQIRDGRLSTSPFDIQLGTTVLNLSGSTGLDQSIDYTGKIQLPASSGSLSQLTTLDLKIGGTFTSPNVSVDTKSMANQALQSVADKAIDKVGQKLGLDSTTTANKDSLTQKVTEKAAEKALDFLKKKLK